MFKNCQKLLQPGKRKFFVIKTKFLIIPGNFHSRNFQKSEHTVYQSFQETVTRAFFLKLM